MPCRSDYLKATARETESSHVLEFLKEIDGEPFNHERPAEYYGRIETLDDDTARICDWCKTHDITKQSLELQLWWQRHQRADAEREVKDKRQKDEEKLRQEGLSKLTVAERKALGLKWFGEP